MDKLCYRLLDVFTRDRLCGNPVAVFTRAGDLHAAVMQRIARELNLSETVFVVEPAAGADFSIRIFTPVNELPFAGHPTLGAAILHGALGDSGNTALRKSLVIGTGMGLIDIVDIRTEGRFLGSATMCQPIPTWQGFDSSARLLKALRLEASTEPVDIYHNGPRHVFVGIPSVEVLSGLRPDFSTLAELDDVAVNCYAPAGAGWRMRMFSPAYGVMEDAATGSAAAPLALHLARYGRSPFGEKIEIVQGVELGRPSTMMAKVEGDHMRVVSAQVSGSAVLAGGGYLLAQ
ncbi:PhzF family phenazine biosynthesis protein [Mycobacterium sp. 852002-40037_SCH5390672]|uniref:PhzF family phenazine biosynthesis protein n=1 Tax=Mycobacterium sp. 852002-40037_SCH5390672 TaxID=1834089 RepID=UPI000805C85B|nr:PhzF family phenazine biosynthesis protein [Mycobacterium sp. 852002-40037_SCH5390672]OBB89967.1 2,3-dihydro-3-hydroxyanthranilate isomerase [Mycobacterium sp. 852002-40037_SCH5390672]